MSKPSTSSRSASESEVGVEALGGVDFHGPTPIFLANFVSSRYLDSVSVIDSTALPGAPLDALRELARTEAELVELRQRQVAEARRSGATWDQIGDALGMSRQAAWEYFAKSASERLAESVAPNSDLSEEEAMELAVEEVLAVRRERRSSR